MEIIIFIIFLSLCVFLYKKSDHIRKSISVDINYGIRFTNEQEMYKFTQELSVEVSKRMEEIHVSHRNQIRVFRLQLYSLFFFLYR